VVAALPDEELAQVDLDLRPGPQEVPGVPQIEPVGELLPGFLPREGPRNDIVDFGSVLYYTIVEGGGRGGGRGV
jgi:hypothetical protein